MSEVYTAWSNNCRGTADEQLYVIHGHREGDKRTLCGVRIQEIGEIATIEDIGCKRCKKSKKLNQPTP